LAFSSIADFRHSLLQLDTLTLKFDHRDSMQEYVRNYAHLIAGEQYLLVEYSRGINVRLTVDSTE
jgi:hypothetical protein